MNTYFIKTFGCQMNQSDSEKIEAILDSVGFIKAENLESATMVIFNTCSIKQHAEDRVFGFINNAHKRGQFVGVTGCMVKKTSTQITQEERQDFLENFSKKEKEEYKKQKKEELDPLLMRIKIINFVFRIEDVQLLPEMLEINFPENSRSVLEKSGNYKFDQNDELDYLNIHPKLSESFRATVPIMTGCDKFCTYCIVPFTRGKERSRKYSDIMLECKKHVKNGVQEITLVGQNVNAYFLDDSERKTLQRQTDFAFLLEEIAKISGLKRLKFTSPHPRHMGNDVLEVIARYDNIAKCIHLPVQSGSSKMLQKMGREHNIGRFQDITKKARELMPDITITTDIIVGFCGETEQDFQKTMDLFDEERFLVAFISKYSPRSGTISADKMIDDVTEDEKKSRLHRLTQKLSEISEQDNKKRIGEVENVLVDSVKYSESSQKNYAIGKSEFGRTCQFEVGKRSDLFIGKIVPVKITDATAWAVEGVMF